MPLAQARRWRSVHSGADCQLRDAEHTRWITFVWAPATGVHWEVGSKWIQMILCVEPGWSDGNVLILDTNQEKMPPYWVCTWFTCQFHLCEVSLETLVESLCRLNRTTQRPRGCGTQLGAWKLEVAQAGSDFIKVARYIVLRKLDRTVEPGTWKQKGLKGLLLVSNHLEKAASAYRWVQANWVLLVSKNKTLKNVSPTNTLYCIDNMETTCNGNPNITWNIFSLI